MNKYFMLILAVLLLTGCHKQAEKPVWTSVMEADTFKAAAQSGGKITALLVKEGDPVAKGDTLAILDARELQYSLEQLQGSLGEINAQETVFRTQIEAAEQDLAYQSKRLNRSERLFDAAVIPLQNLEDGQLIHNKAELQVKSANENLKLLDAKRKTLAAQQKIIAKKLNDCIITSPASGRVETLYYKEGEVLPPLGQLAEICDTRDPETNIYVAEEWLAKLKPEMEFRLKAQGDSRPISARVIKISNKAEFTPKTVLTPDNRSVMVYAVRLRADNTAGILKDGMPVDVTLP